MPNGGGRDDLLLVRVLVPPQILPMTRRLIDSCILSEHRSVSDASDSGSGDLMALLGKAGLPFMLDVVGINVELLNSTFDAFQLDKRVDLAALNNASIPTQATARQLLSLITRPTANYTGDECAVFSRGSCMFQAVKCNASGFPASWSNTSAFDCSTASACAVPCGCCRALAHVEAAKESAREALGQLMSLNSTLRGLQDTAARQLDPSM